MKYAFIIMLISTIVNVSCTSQNSTDEQKTDTVQNSIISELIRIEPQEKAKYSNVRLIPTPQSFERIQIDSNSFGQYLRNLELKTDNNQVYLYNGQLKYYQKAQFAVIKMDVGKRDLQQCADAVMRLRAEYFYQNKQFNEIHFNFLSDGKARYFRDYSPGNYSYTMFRKYMDYIFSYANTASLKNELNKVTNSKDMQIGDVFIQKGNPYGHAVTVMDIAVNQQGSKVFMLSQSFMPAQEIHILKNPENHEISPWFELKPSGNLNTPEWTFNFDDLMRF